MQRNQYEYDVVVVGMGPIGLAAAYEALRHDKFVLLLEKRTEKKFALRPQATILWASQKSMLLNMIRPEEDLDEQDIRFLNTMILSQECKIRDVQRFILNRIKSQQRNKIVRIKYAAELESVDIDNGRLRLNDSDCTFTHLVAADGAF